MPTLHLFALLVLTLDLTAQAVSPRSFARVDGNVGGLEPFASSVVPFRHLQVHDDLVGTPQPVASLTFRLDRFETTSAIRFQATVCLSDAAPGIHAGNLSSTFDANHGANKVTVSQGVWFDFPAVPSFDPRRDFLPRAFTHQMAFPAFPYRGTSGLVWDVLITSRQVATNQGSLDKASGANSNPSALFVDYTAQTCRTGVGASLIQLNASDAPSWPNSLRLTLGARNLLPMQPATVLCGLSNTWAGNLRLPYLLPSSSTAPSGPCYLAASSEVELSGSTLPNGTFSISTALPLNPSLHGGRVFLQVLAWAPGANPLGIVSSDAAYVQVRAPYPAVPVGQVSLRGTGSLGTVSRNEGLIVRVN